MCLIFFHINNQEDKDTTYFKKGNIEESASSYTLQTEITGLKNDIHSFWPKVMIRSFKLTRCLNTLQLYKKVPNQISTNLENSIANPLRYWSGQTGESNTWEEDKMRKLRETGGFHTYTHTKGTCQAEQQAGQDERFYLLIFHIRNESRSRQETKKLTEKLLWAILRPRLKAIMALCIMTATKIVNMLFLLFCRPMARP